MALPNPEAPPVMAMVLPFMDRKLGGMERSISVVGGALTIAFDMMMMWRWGRGWCRR